MEERHTDTEKTKVNDRKLTVYYFIFICHLLFLLKVTIADFFDDCVCSCPTTSVRGWSISSFTSRIVYKLGYAVLSWTKKRQCESNERCYKIM